MTCLGGCGRPSPVADDTSAFVCGNCRHLLGRMVQRERAKLRDCEPVELPLAAGWVMPK